MVFFGTCSCSRRRRYTYAKHVNYKDAGDPVFEKHGLGLVAMDEGDFDTAAEHYRRVIELDPGTYTFRVTNTDVPYELGFWLREHDYELGNPLHKLSKTSVSGGGLTQGKTQDYEVELEPGEYLYSCPLNPTPDYRIVVKG